MHQPEADAAREPIDRALESPLPTGAVGPPAAAPRALASGRAGVYWWIVAAVIIADQASKLAIIATIPLFGSVQVIPNFFDLVHVHNPGVAFGFLNDLDAAYQKLVTTLLAAGALAGIAYYARHIRPEERLARLGLSVILGGALGNLFDRLRLGYVTDFADIYWGNWHFWAFNVADASITIGAIMVFADLLLVNRHASDPV